MNKVYEVFSCRNGEWIMAGSTPDRSDGERLFAETLKDKACQGARLVEESLDPNTGDIRDRVIQKRDKQENLPYFNPRKASEAAAAAKRAGARAAAAGGAPGAPGAGGKPGKPGAAPPVSAAAVQDVAAAAAMEAGGDFSRVLIRNMMAIGIPAAAFIAHERFVKAAPTEWVLGGLLVVTLVALVLLNRNTLTADPAAARPARKAARRAAAPPPRRRKRMQVIGVLGQGRKDGTDAATADGPRPEVVEEDTRTLLQLLHQSLEVLAGDGRFVRGGRLSQLDVFGCHLFFAGAAETAFPPGQRNPEERTQALKTALSVLSGDQRMVDWFLGGLDQHRADPKAAAMFGRGSAAGTLWRDRDAAAGGRLLEALVAWNAPDPDGAPTLTLLYATLPAEAPANPAGERLALARVRGAMGNHGGREQRATDRSLVASFVSPRDAVAAAAAAQIGNEADRAGDASVPQLRLAVHGRSGLSLTDEAALGAAVAAAAALATGLAAGTVVLSAPVARAVEGVYGMEPLGAVAADGGSLEAFALGTAARPTTAAPSGAEAEAPAPADAVDITAIDPDADIAWDDLDAALNGDEGPRAGSPA